MRFRKGSRVEVLNKSEVASGSWRSAEIISGNGHNYNVRYDGCAADMGLAMERVPRKAIRPCPPPVGGQRNWVPGDIAEVFGNGSWKPAEISRIVAGNYYFVRFLGSLREFRAHISYLRCRQSWQSNKWILIEKVSGTYIDEKVNKQPEAGKVSNLKHQQCAKMKNCSGEDQILDHNGNNFEGRHLISSGGMKKRPHFWLSSIERNVGTRRKSGAIKKGSKRRRVDVKISSQLPKKVDAVASPETVLGEKYMHASLNNKTNGFSKIGSEWGDPNADVVHFVVGSLDVNGSESPSSSVGSCSHCSSPYRPLHDFKSSTTRDSSGQSDNAEALCGSRGESPQPINEGLATEVHQLELCAYRSTMVALYASGPLNWEQEALMTNLRLMLHISNDEHLMELRHLASTKTESS